MQAQKHSRNFYVVMIDHYTKELPTLEDGPKKTAITARLDEYRIALSVYDMPRRGRGTATVVEGEIDPSLSRTWIDEWYERAKDWLQVHKRGESSPRIRLAMGADLEALASETRVKIIARRFDDDKHNEVIIIGPARRRLLSLIQSGGAV